MIPTLDNRVVLITGSSSGIGKATALLAKEYGAIPVVHGKTESDELKQLAEQLECEYIFGDVSDKKAVSDAIQGLVTRVGRIDALVNSAGTLFDESFQGSTDEDWLEIMRVNLLGTLHLCQEVAPMMMRQGYGKIVNVASQRGHSNTANNGRMAYSASKASVINLTASLAKELAPSILVNAVSPGHVNTPLSKQWSEKSRKQANSSLLKRPLEPKEIAEAILFLASERNSAITGQTILVDGGYSLSEK